MSNLSSIRFVFLAAALLVASMPVHAEEAVSSNQNEIKLTLHHPEAWVNGRQLIMQEASVLNNGVTLVPLRFISEALNAEVTWEESTRSIYLLQDEKALHLTMGSSNVWVDGRFMNLETPPVMIGETTMVPLRFISEQMDQEVSYDAATGSITIRGTLEAAQSAEEPMASSSTLRRLDIPTVDTLTIQVGLPGIYEPPRIFGSGFGMFSSVKQESIWSITADSGEHVYMIDYDMDRPIFSAFQISVYDQQNGDYLKLKNAVPLDEKFTMEYKDQYNQIRTLPYYDIIPQKLFYDEVHNRVYLLATTDKRDVKAIYYQILPEVKLLTYHLDETLDMEKNMLSTLDGNQFYYSNASRGRIYSLIPGEERRTTGFLESERRADLTAAVKDGSIYLFDKANKTIYRIGEDGYLVDPVQVPAGEIIGGAARDGGFIFAEEQGFYRVDVTGNVEEYVKLSALTHNPGVYVPEKGYLSMLPGVDGYDEFPDIPNSQVRERNPAPLQLRAPLDFTVDYRGNIVLYDSGNRILRRINVFAEGS